MSLEQALQENTAAMNAMVAASKELVAALAGLNAGEKISPSGVSGTIGDTTRVVEKPKEDKPKKPAAETASSPKDATPPASEKAEAASGLSYDDVKAPFLRILKDHGEKVAKEILTQLQAKTLKDVNPENFQAAFDLLTAKEKELSGADLA